MNRITDTIMPHKTIIRLSGVARNPANGFPARPLAGASRVLRPEHGDVANAIGAAIAQVGGQVEKVFSLEDVGRDEALESIRSEAIGRAVAAGAEPGIVEVVELDEIPLTYLPGNATLIRAKAVGDLGIIQSG